MKKSKTAARKSDLYGEIRSLIDAARNRVAVSVNAELTMLYWNVGHRINEEVLGNKRAAYGKQVVEELSKRLVGEFGAGWSYRQLMFCTQFAIYFPEIEIVNTLCSQLSWSHIKVLLCREERGACAPSGAHEGQCPRRLLPDRTSTARGLGAEVSSGNRGRPSSHARGAVTPHAHDGIQRQRR